MTVEETIAKHEHDKELVWFVIVTIVFTVLVIWGLIGYTSVETVDSVGETVGTTGMEKLRGFVGH